MLRYLFQSNLSVSEMFITGISILIVLAYSLSIHEFMHGYSAYRLGDDTAKLQGRLTMNPLAHLDPIGTLMMLFVGFGWAKPTPVNYGKLTRLKNRSNSIRIVSVAGVTANFLSALVAYFLRSVLLVIFFKSGLFNQGDSVLTIGNVIYFKSLLFNEGDSVIKIIGIIINLLEYFFFFNLLLMAFNLLPFPPLDGYHIVETFIPFKYKSRFQQYERYFSMGLLVLIVIGLFTGSSPLYWIVEKIVFPFSYIITMPLNILIRLVIGV